MTDRAKVTVTVAVCATVLAWGLFVWPTPYRYEKVTRPFHNGQHFEEVYRVNRLTGHTERVLTPYPHFPDSSQSIPSP